MKPLTKIKLFAVLALLVLIALQTNLFSDTSFLTGSATFNIKNTPFESGNYSLYLCPEDDCEQAMIDFFNNSEDIMCAFYDLNLERIKSILPEDHVLVFEDNYDGYGIPVKSRGLMHNKFCIAEKNKVKMVMTGSLNPTLNGVKKNNNNLFIIESSYLYKNYLNEYEELSGRAKEAEVEYPLINHSGFLIENYFCPEDECENHVLNTLSDADRSIHFMTFSFTSKPIGDLLLKKSRQGADVEGVFERRQQSRYSEYEMLKDAGINVLLDGNPATMHHKVFVIDNSTAVIGSYNPTASGNERNDENILILHNPGIAQALEAEFKRVYAEGE